MRVFIYLVLTWIAIGWVDAASHSKWRYAAQYLRNLIRYLCPMSLMIVIS